MRIAIDARLLGPAKNKGLGRYVEQLMKNLENIDHDNDCLVFLLRENWDEYTPNNSRFKKALADYKWYSFAEQIFLPLKLWWLKVDLVHFPHFNVPLLYRGKFIVTIHDLIMYKFPDERATTRNRWLYKIKYWLHKVVVRSAVKRAEQVIVPSEFTKDDIVREFNVEPGKVKVIYLGFETGDKVNGSTELTTSKVNKIVNKVNNAAVLKKYGIKKPYLLYVGNAYPHKNLERLIEAFEIICKEYPELRLVLVGKDDFFYSQLKHQAIQASSIIFTDHISNGELAELYRNATAYVFPSLYEGFGLPGLEAMNYGVPVVSSKASCLPEIYGDAALYFDPTDTDDLCKKIVQLLRGENLRKKLVTNGFERLKKYSWRECAQKTFESYTHLLNDN